MIVFMRASTSTKRITVRLPSSLQTRLKKRAKVAGKTESEIVREAVEAHVSRAHGRESAYDVAKRLGLVGCAKGLPPDLSTNPKYMEGFGTRR
jgi:predicted DNA-binding protein